MKARLVHSHPQTNPGKTKALDELQAVYRTDVQKYVNEMVVAKRHHLKPAEWRPFFSASPLSSQLAKNASAQAVHLVENWVKSLYHRLKRRIFEQPFVDHQRMELRCIGKYLLTKAGKFGKGTISQEMIDLYWSWVWDSEVSGSPPAVSDDFPMWLSEMCVAFGECKKATGLGRWWIAVSCLHKGKRVQIPLTDTPFLKAPKDFAKSVLIHKRCGRWLFQFTDKQPDTVFEPSERKIGLDVGLNVLAATSDGKLLGQHIKPEFDRRYEQVRDIRANRQRQDLKKDSKRLARLERKLTGFVKTTVGTVVNMLVERHPKTTFVIEDLNLRGCKGQKRFAYKALHRSLVGKAFVEVVNPAYTSQMCPSCGYVSRKNRNGIRFECRSCGRVSHADVVGAVNLLGRSEDKQVPLKLHHRKVGTILRERFRRRRTSSSRRVRSRTVRPDAHCSGTQSTASNAVRDESP